MMVEQSDWVRITQEDPTHSDRYIERFRTMHAEGRDLAGEARFVDTMASRNARILDAGCGPGRVGGALAALGHDVVGVDVDPVLIAAAHVDHAGPTWIVADLAELDLAAQGLPSEFEVIVSAGNVMTFLAPSTRRSVLRRLRAHLADNGRLVIGFGSGRGYEFDDFFADVDAVGLTADVVLGTWDLRAFTADSNFVVAVLRERVER